MIKSMYPVHLVKVEWPHKVSIITNNNMKNHLQQKTLFDQLEKAENNVFLNIKKAKLFKKHLDKAYKDNENILTFLADN
ncbi:MAG: hypothetical protein COA63_014030 [Methylophaga sp.]|nr:hypothetical protein [Methylophaga sp.]